MTGITPAWAGKSSRGWRIHPPVRDHPRVGGEKRRLSECAQWAEGSPPRGRGKEGIVLARGPAEGITPAWAGKRLHQLQAVFPAWDHPRVGGEKSMRSTKTAPSSGSPPRGRGKVYPRLSSKSKKGITPAWAGKSCPPCGHIRGGRDHPRVGGEKPTVARHFSWGMGSPPRGRGKGHGHLQGHGACGITPAWAGKSQRSPLPGRAQRDHPRVGGEK